MSRTSSVLDHSLFCKTRKSKVNIQEFKIIEKNFEYYHERKSCEALMIGFHKPSLNLQVDYPNILNIFEPGV